jgi:hypothetical protein
MNRDFPLAPTPSIGPGKEKRQARKQERYEKKQQRVAKKSPGREYEPKVKRRDARKWSKEMGI